MGNTSSAQARSYRVQNNSICQIIVRCHNPSNFSDGWGGIVTVEPGQNAEVFNHTGRSPNAEIKFIYEGVEIYTHDISLNQNLLESGGTVHIYNTHYLGILVNRGRSGPYRPRATWGDISHLVAQRRQATERRQLQERAQTLVQTGQTERLAGRYAQALLILNQAIELDANNAAAFFNRGEVLRMQGNNEAALADLNRCLTLNPTDDTRQSVIASRGITYWQTGRPSEYPRALEDLNSVIQLNPGNTFALGYRGKVYLSMGNYVEAKRNFDAALAINPDLQWIINSRETKVQELAVRGRTERAAGHYAQALELLNQALQLNPNNTVSLYNRGETYRMQGNNEAALADLNRCLTLNPTNETRQLVIASRGITYWQPGRPSEYPRALEDLNSVIQLNPGNTFALGYRGKVYLSMGNYVEAKRNFDAALAINPDLQWIINSRETKVQELAVRGRTERAAGHYAQALELLNQALQLNPNNTLALFNRGKTYRMQGNNEAALADLNRCLTLNPTDEIRRRTFGSRGAVHWRLGNFQLALNDLNQVLALNEHNVFALSYRGRVYASQGRYDDAIRDFGAALLIKPGLTGVQTSRMKAIKLRAERARVAQTRNSLNELNTLLQHPVLQPELPRASDSLRASRRNLIASARLLVALRSQPDNALTTTIATQINQAFIDLNTLIGDINSFNAKGSLMMRSAILLASGSPLYLRPQTRGRISPTALSEGIVIRSIRGPGN